MISHDTNAAQRETPAHLGRLRALLDAHGMADVDLVVGPAGPSSRAGAVCAPASWPAQVRSLWSAPLVDVPGTGPAVVLSCVTLSDPARPAERAWTLVLVTRGALPGAPARAARAVAVLGRGGAVRIAPNRTAARRSHVTPLEWVPLASASGQTTQRPDGSHAMFADTPDRRNDDRADSAQRVQGAPAVLL
jgi:hypothetical protein